MTTSNSVRFLVDITKHLIEIHDRSKRFNAMAHAIKDTERYKAGDTVLIHTFQDVSGFDRPSITVWRGGQCLRTRINN